METLLDRGGESEESLPRPTGLAREQTECPTETEVYMRELGNDH